jgi:phage terminase Nu1 subunit (DNA packaging protein)
MAGKNGDSLLKKVVSLSDVASLCVCSERTIQRLTKSGVLRQAKDRERRIMRGRYVLGDAVPRFVESLRDSITSDDPSERAYVEARSRRMRALAESEELRVKHQRGALIKLETVSFWLSLILRSCRDRLRAIPSRTLHQLTGMTDARQINQLLQKEIDAGLSEIADTNLREKFRKEIDEYFAQTDNGDEPERARAQFS